MILAGELQFYQLEHEGTQIVCTVNTYQAL